jgi:hypothetical protein
MSNPPHQRWPSSFIIWNCLLMRQSTGVGDLFHQVFAGEIVAGLENVHQQRRRRVAAPSIITATAVDL